MLNTNYYHSEAYTNAECGLEGTIRLPYVPISKYEKHANTRIYNVGPMYNSPYPYTAMGNANITGRDDASVMEIARICDGTPSCVSFDTNGNLYDYMLKSYEYPCAFNGIDTYTRKCGKGLPMFTTFFK
jgi:hypothetical protein